MFIIAGLGNPGADYENTRHNIGFTVVDELQRKWGGDFTYKKNFKAEVCESRCGHEKVLLVKPQTYMNLSGEAIVPLLRYYKLEADQLLVVCDDLDMPVGRVKLVQKGSAGGNNGLKSIIQHLGSQEFPRLKLGIGRPIHPGQSPSQYVLQKFSKEQEPLVEEVMQVALQASESFIKQGLKEAMNAHNGHYGKKD